MGDLINAVCRVVAESRHVNVAFETVGAFVEGVSAEKLVAPEDVSSLAPGPLSSENLIAFPVVVNAINFCFWGEPKWTVQDSSGSYQGSAGLFHALSKAVNEGCDLLNPKYLAIIPEEDLRRILTGNVEIPLFEKRLHMLRELGKGICGLFGGSFTPILKAADYDAAKIAELLATKFPSVFEDAWHYQERKLLFRKRAQLAAYHLAEMSNANLIPRITGAEKLTGFADYKIPQILRELSILEYTARLSSMIDNKVELPPGSPEEVEIRAATVYTIFLIAYELNVRKGFSFVHSALVDGLLWRQAHSMQMTHPHHRTRTTCY